MNDRFVNSTHRPNRWRVAAAERGDHRTDADELIDSLLNEPDDADPDPPAAEHSPAVELAADPPATEAVRRFDEFLRAFADRTAADWFAVKARFIDDYGREDLWLTVTAVDASHIYGELDTDPATVRALRRGQAVRVMRAGLNDWVYTHAGQRVGGFTAAAHDSRANGEAA